LFPQCNREPITWKGNILIQTLHKTRYYNNKTIRVKTSEYLCVNNIRWCWSMASSVPRGHCSTRPPN